MRFALASGRTYRSFTRMDNAKVRKLEAGKNFPARALFSVGWPLVAHARLNRTFGVVSR